MKFKEYPETTSLAENDAFIIDGDSGTKHILFFDLVGSISPQAHFRIFRGKNLGSTVTDEQKAAIKDGSFKDLFLGDYWEINGVKWRIVDMDYWYDDRGQGQGSLQTHHLVIMPDTSLYSSSIGPITNGYLGSYMYQNGLTQAKNTISEIFGDMVLTHKEYLSNAVTDGIVSGKVFTDSTVELPSELMIFGRNEISPINDGTCNFKSAITSNIQLALFDVAPQFIVDRGTYYYALRDIASSDNIVAVSGRAATYHVATGGMIGVRPYFCIG